MLSCLFTARVTRTSNDMPKATGRFLGIPADGMGFDVQFRIAGSTRCNMVATKRSQSSSKSSVFDPFVRIAGREIGYALILPRKRAIRSSDAHDLRWESKRRLSTRSTTVFSARPKAADGFLRREQWRTLPRRRSAALVEGILKRRDSLKEIEAFRPALSREVNPRPKDVPMRVACWLRDEFLSL